MLVLAPLCLSFQPQATHRVLSVFFKPFLKSHSVLLGSGHRPRPEFTSQRGLSHTSARLPGPPGSPWRVPHHCGFFLVLRSPWPHGSLTFPFVLFFTWSWFLPLPALPPATSPFSFPFLPALPWAPLKLTQHHESMSVPPLPRHPLRPSPAGFCSFDP